jgi:predicted ArsR family transcriptional regulator
VAHLSQQLARIGALSEPTRQVLYDYVASQPAPVSREQAAEAVSMPAHSVRFHLDKLVAAGLLEVDYRRLSGRTGPGAGRPSKMYRRSSHQLSVSLPPRTYELAGRLLAAAIERAGQDDVPVEHAVRTVSREEGRRLAHDRAVEAPRRGSSTDDPPDRDSSADVLARVAAVLATVGYEPRVAGHAVTLTNCPFDRLAADHTELVCGMSQALVTGILEGLEITTLTARLTPEPGMCCVNVAPVLSNDPAPRTAYPAARSGQGYEAPGKPTTGWTS